ncbi:3'-5' exonuclease [Clostridium perfringens]
MLNEKQMQVVNELDKNILLLASAGTGKTNTLAERIKNILENQKAEASEVLCVTFTNKACKEMKDRVISLVGSDGNDIEVKTFHGLCFDIIKQEAKRNTDLYTGFTIYDEEDTLSLMKEFLEENVSAKDIKGMIDFIKRGVIEYCIFSDNKKNDYEQVVRLISQDEKKIKKFLSNYKHNEYTMRRIFQDYGAKYTDRYNEVLRKNGAVDFQDLLNLTYELFLDESVVERYSRKYKYINVDEMQDTSLVEYSIIERIFAKNNILLCGDNFQTIYEWRGSNPKIIFQKFNEKYSPLNVVFDCNYRATKILTECAADFLNKAFPGEVQTMYDTGLMSYSEEEGEKISFRKGKDINDEARWIKDKILALPEEERKSVCILTRNNNYNISLSSNLREVSDGKLDFALIDDSKFFRKTEIKDVLAFLKLAANHNDATALKRILKRISYRIGDATIANIESPVYKENGIVLTDLIDLDALENNDKFSILVDALNNDNIVVFDVESTGTDTTRDEIIQIAAIRIDSKGKEIERFMKFLKTDKLVGASEAVHGFSDEFIKNNGEDKEKVLLEFSDFIRGKVIVGHNVQYDINILSSELGRRNLPKIDILTFYDTLDLYRRFYPNLDNHKLEFISNLVDTEHKPNHNALYDILATAEILVNVVEKDVVPTTEKRVELMKKVPDRFRVLAEDMNSIFSKIEDKRPNDIIRMIVTGYNLIKIFGADSQQAENLRELYFVAQLHDDKTLSNRDSLLDFVKITSLSDGEMERILLGKGKIPIITIHQSKGLEFKYTFLAGMQDYTLPNYFSISSNRYDEEKRILYVAITRAKKKLHISYSASKNGKYQNASRLLEYLDNKYIEEEF